MIWTSEVDVRRPVDLLTRTYRHAHELIILFYDRDSRKEFVGQDNWLVKMVKPSGIIQEYDKGKLRNGFIHYKCSILGSWLFRAL